MQQSETFGVSRRALFLYSALAVATVALPLLLWRLPYPFIRLMDATYHPIPLLQLFVFCAAVALTGVGGYTLYRHWGEHLSRQFPLLLSLLVFFHFLALLRQHAARSWDYHCYEQAAQAIVQGLNPYGNCYLYFPTPAQTLAWLYTVGAYGASLVITDGATKTAQLWDLVFYWYEAMQFLQLILAYALCYRLARRLGLAQGRAGLLVAGLFLFNNPLLATLKHNQVNLWVLNSILLAMLWLPRAPLLSGLCVAFGGHVKIYPLILLLPWILTRQWRALGGAALGMVGVLLVQTKGGQDWQLWQAFLAFAGAFPQGTLFRDNSLHSLVYNSIGHLKWLLGDASHTVNEHWSGALSWWRWACFGLLYLPFPAAHTARSQPVTDKPLPHQAPYLPAPIAMKVVMLSRGRFVWATRPNDHATT
ncbi:MAG: glycosyltransferase family 87 protein [Caldilineaceae bacterium]